MTESLPNRSAFDADAPPALPDSDGRVVAVVTTESAADWASAGVVELCKAWGRRGRRVVLFDGGIDRPSLHGFLGRDNDEGLTDAVVYGASVGRVARRVVDQPLFFVPAGTVVADPGGVLEHPRWAGMCRGFLQAGATLVVFVPVAGPGVRRALSDATDVVVLAEAGDDVAAMIGDQATKVRAVLGGEGFRAPEAPFSVDEGLAGAPEGLTDPEDGLAGADAVPELGMDLPDAVTIPGEEGDADESSEGDEAFGVDAASPEGDPFAPVETPGEEVEDDPFGLDESGEASTESFDLDHESFATDAGADDPFHSMDVADDEAEGGWGGLDADASTDDGGAEAHDLEQDVVFGGAADAGATVADDPFDGLEFVPDADGSRASADEEPASDRAGFPSEPTDDDLDDPFAAAGFPLAEPSDEVPPPAGGDEDLMDPLGAPPRDDSEERVPTADEIIAEAEAGEAEQAAGIPPAKVAAKRESNPVTLVVLLLLLLGVVAGAWWFGYLEIPGLARPTVEALPGGTALAASPGEDAARPTTPTAAAFSVALESHRDADVAWRRMDELAARLPDRLWIVAPVDVDGTVYHRVLAGPATDSAAAESLAVSLAGILGADASEWVVRATARAFFLGMEDDRTTALDRAAGLREDGVPAYVLSVRGPGGTARYRVYAGAYADADEASHLAAVLQERGLTATLSERSGDVP